MKSKEELTEEFQNDYMASEHGKWDVCMVMGKSPDIPRGTAEAIVRLRAGWEFSELYDEMILGKKPELHMEWAH